MSNPVQVLFDEHELIISAIDLAKKSEKLIDKDNALYETTVRDLIVFFRNYADKYHHYKEEEILFPEMAIQNELLAEGIIKEMLQNHEDFREMIADIEKSLNKKDYPSANATLQKYTEALLDHIAVENDEVFQAAESLFTEDELQKMYFRFADTDRELGNERKEELAKMIEDMRKNLE